MMPENGSFAVVCVAWGNIKKELVLMIELDRLIYLDYRESYIMSLCEGKEHTR